jgi:hypothetical protein
VEILLTRDHKVSPTCSKMCLACHSKSLSWSRFTLVYLPPLGSPGLYLTSHLALPLGFTVNFRFSFVTISFVYFMWPQSCNQLTTLLDDNHTKLSGHSTKYMGSLYMLQLHNYLYSFSVNYWHWIIYQIVFLHQEQSPVSVKKSPGKVMICSCTQPTLSWTITLKITEPLNVQQCAFVFL